MEIVNPFLKDKIKVETDFCGRKLKLEINQLAFRSQAAVLASYGDTVVLANVNVGQIDHNIDYFPLSVDYEERFYAAGKISGSRYVKREGRPSDDAVLIGRLIDRPIRPLFPKGYRYPVQVVATVLSLDSQIRPDALAMLAVSTAISLTGVPFDGPVAGVRIAQEGDQLVVYPTKDQETSSDLDIMIASNAKGIMMVEAGTKEVGEDTVIEALRLAHRANQDLIKLQKDLLSQVEVKPQEYQLILPTEEIKQATAKYLEGKLESVLSINYIERLAKIQALKDDFAAYLEAKLSEEDLKDQGLYFEALESQLNSALREKIIKTQKRLDDRALDEVRPLSSQVSFLPRTHGSALFTRGATQALNIVTLASTSFTQLIDTMERDEEVYYFHHYNAPGYTVGEIKRMGSPGRREIGHSYLAQRSIEPVLPSPSEFPYTIRSVTEIMSQQGSTSMAAACASCLALMDAGVPIKRPVSGIAMGLIMNGDQPLILTDIADAEDFAGDMDFKVAGTRKGITALQMDMKVSGLPVDVLAQALKASIKGRQVILDHMLSVLEAPRQNLSPFAPRVVQLQISVHKIKDLIGKGGETIHALINETGAKIDVKDDGRVLVFCEKEEALKQTVRQIEELTAEPTLGKVYRQKPVVKVADFGVFVNFTHNHDGLVHVSEMSHQHVRSPSDILKVGDKVDVKLVAIDEHGRFNLSIKQVNKK